VLSVTPRRALHAILSLLLLLPLLCTPARASALATNPAIEGVLSGSMQPPVRIWDLPRWRAPLRKLYAQRHFVPVWFSGRQLSPSGLSLIQELRDAESRGLRPEDYDGNLLAAHAAELAQNPLASPSQIAALDVVLSATAARIAVDLHAGRIAPRDAGYDLDVPQAAMNVESAVLALAAAKDVRAVLDDLEPDFRHYELLKTALARYRSVAHESPEAARRVRQIVLTLERARWLPAKLDSPPIVVNIPQFRLFAFQTTQDHADEIVQMDVIVGSDFPGRETPVFAADMKYVVLNPYWDVPYSILKKELLPSIRKDARWVGRNGYEIVKGQSDQALVQEATPANIELLSQGVLRLRQKPGPNNSLGRVKFMFPNRHNVYMHDTPARALFEKSRRAFSHGCIRVSDPIGLLQHVLREDETWTAERIDAVLQTGRPTRVPLSKPIRVMIIYGTAMATERGETLFFEDIYRHDARLEALLANRRRGG
jgi:murein L,D-transpeptidase YcbB/YkuD